MMDDGRRSIHHRLGGHIVDGSVFVIASVQIEVESCDQTGHLEDSTDAKTDFNEFIECKIFLKGHFWKLICYQTRKRFLNDENRND